VTRRALGLSAALALLVAPVIAARGGPAIGSASGTFEDRKLKVQLNGAYAFRDKSAGMDDAHVIQVAVSNAKFVSGALDDYYDSRHAIDTLFADEESKVVYFELDDSGRYHGLSYYFGPGDGCGFCFDSTVKSTVRPVDGRLKGEISYESDDRRFRFQLDVPIPPKQWGDALPKDGGDPGKAYLAYHRALEQRDKKALWALFDADERARWEKYAKEDKIDEWLDFRWKEEHSELTSIRITGGFVNGERAVVLFDGKNGYIDAMHGEAQLRRENGAWRVGGDMVSVGARD
jgi:hypothetical protein